MVLRTMKNCHSPTTHLAAALLGAAMATTLLTNEPLGLSLTPRLEKPSLMKRRMNETERRNLMRNEILLEVHMETPCGNPCTLALWCGQRTLPRSTDRVCTRVYTDRGDPKNASESRTSAGARGTLQEPQRRTEHFLPSAWLGLQTWLTTVARNMARPSLDSHRLPRCTRDSFRCSWIIWRGS